MIKKLPFHATFFSHSAQFFSVRLDDSRRQSWLKTSGKSTISRPYADEGTLEVAQIEFMLSFLTSRPSRQASKIQRQSLSFTAISVSDIVVRVELFYSLRCYLFMLTTFTSAAAAGRTRCRRHQRRRRCRLAFLHVASVDTTRLLLFKHLPVSIQNLQRWVAHHANETFDAAEVSVLEVVLRRGARGGAAARKRHEAAC